MNNNQNAENYKSTRKPHGEISMVMHKGGTYNPQTGKIEGAQEILDKKEVKNLIVNSASRLMAYRMAPMQISETGTDVTELEGILGLQYLAVGVGILKDPTLPYDKVTNPVDAAQWDPFDPPEAQLTDVKLIGEIARKPFTSWAFVDENDQTSTTPTNILKLVTTFTETEAVGPLTEMGLYGGNATDEKDSGYLFNRKTYAVWSKSSDSRLTIQWRITF